MKELINKCIQTITAILISSIVVYGVYAQKVCCKTIIDACIPASDRISSGYTTGSHWTTSQSQRRNIQLQSNLDGLVKSPKRANFQISHLIISTGYEIEI
jgi:hypothetical protein